MAILTCGAISFIGSTIVIFLAEMGVVKELPHVEEVLCVGAIASILLLDYLLPDKE
jgi:UDP-glucose 4-epimerase